MRVKGWGTAPRDFCVHGKRLSSLPSWRVKELLRILYHIDGLLSKVSQHWSVYMRNSLLRDMKILVTEKFLRHTNIDVKVAVAACLTKLTRITTPDSPYDDVVMKQVFQIIVEAFQNLDDIRSPSFSKRVSILETVARSKLCLLMLDLECDDLILKMFQYFLKTTILETTRNTFYYMETIMSAVLEESEDISQGLISCLLESVKIVDGISPNANELGERVIYKCAEKLKPYFMKLSTQSISKYSQVVASLCQAQKNNVNEEDVSEEDNVSEEDESGEDNISEEVNVSEEKMVHNEDNVSEEEVSIEDEYEEEDESEKVNVSEEKMTQNEDNVNEEDVSEEDNVSEEDVFEEDESEEDNISEEVDVSEEKMAHNEDNVSEEEVSKEDESEEDKESEEVNVSEERRALDEDDVSEDVSEEDNVSKEVMAQNEDNVSEEDVPEEEDVSEEVNVSEEAMEVHVRIPLKLSSRKSQLEDTVQTPKTGHIEVKSPRQTSEIGSSVSNVIRGESSQKQPKSRLRIFLPKTKAKQQNMLKENKAISAQVAVKKTVASPKFAKKSQVEDNLEDGPNTSSKRKRVHYEEFQRDEDNANPKQQDDGHEKKVAGIDQRFDGNIDLQIHDKMEFQQDEDNTDNKHQGDRTEREVGSIYQRLDSIVALIHEMHIAQEAHHRFEQWQNHVNANFQTIVSNQQELLSRIAGRTPPLPILSFFNASCQPRPLHGPEKEVASIYQRLDGFLVLIHQMQIAQQEAHHRFEQWQKHVDANFQTIASNQQELLSRIVGRAPPLPTPSFFNTSRQPRPLHGPVKDVISIYQCLDGIMVLVHQMQIAQQEAHHRFDQWQNHVDANFQTIASNQQELLSRIVGGAPPLPTPSFFNTSHQPGLNSLP